MKAQLDWALSKNIPYMVIIGAKEVQDGLVTVKDLAANVESKMPRAEMVPFLQGKTGGSSGGGRGGGADGLGAAEAGGGGGAVNESASSPTHTAPSVAVRGTAKFSVLDLPGVGGGVGGGSGAAPAPAAVKPAPTAKAVEEEEDEPFDFGEEEEEEEVAAKPSSRAEKAKALKAQRDAELEEKKKVRVRVGRCSENLTIQKTCASPPHSPSRRQRLGSRKKKPTSGRCATSKSSLGRRSRT